MKKVLAIVLVSVLGISLVSAPAFAQKAELSLKYWHAGVGGGDLQVGDVEAYEAEYYYDEPSGGSGIGYWFSVGEFVGAERLALKFRSGTSVILSASYHLSPTSSLGVSYWSVSRGDKLLKALGHLDAKFQEEAVDSGGNDRIDKWSDMFYFMVLPWLTGDDMTISSYRERRYGEDDYRISSTEGFISAEGGISMWALDISVAKAFCSPDRGVGFSAGIRKADFNQNESASLELLYEWKRKTPSEDELSFAIGDSYSLDSNVTVSAIGPQLGVEGTYALSDKLALKASAKAGLLFGTAKTHANLTLDGWESDPDTPTWFPRDPKDFYDVSYSEYPLTQDTIRISTYDLGIDMAYRITEQWSAEAGYYVSIWSGVPSLVQSSVDVFETGDDDYGYEVFWEQQEARSIFVSGLTFGLSYKF